MSEMFVVPLRYNNKTKDTTMSEVELYLIGEGENCTLYTLQFLRDSDNEFEKFVSKILILGNGDVKKTRTYEPEFGI